MGENIHKNLNDQGMDSTCVLALEAPNKSGSFAKPRRPRRRKILTDEPKNEGWLVGTLTVSSGEDVVQKVLSFFRNSTNNSLSSHGRARMGIVLAATGSVLHPRNDTESSSASYKGSCPIINLGGRYIISEDGQVQQHVPLTILCGDSNGHAVWGQVNGCLVAEGPVEVLVGSFCTEGEEEV